MARNLFCLYPQLLKQLNEFGVSASPRGKNVLEMEKPTMWTISNPEEWCLFIPGRKINPFFALAEVVWMWSGKGGLDFIQFYNKSIAQFLDKGVPYFHGSYGKRARHYGYSELPFRNIPSVRQLGTETPDVEVDQIIHVIGKLQQDKETRQAVMVLWDPVKDNLVSSLDHPCNNVIYFWLRKGALNMTVVRRSNDLVWGVPYNMIQFSHLQALVAGSLGVQVGAYHVVANNLHFYKNLYEDTLDQVLGWALNVNKNCVDLNKMSNTFYHGDSQWDMRWDLCEFDKFVAYAWDPFEKMSRQFLEQQLPVISELSGSVTIASNTIAAFYNTRIMAMERDFDSYSVPKYWKNVFRMLLAYHCRKAKARELYSALITETPYAFQWLANDFYEKVIHV